MRGGRGTIAAAALYVVAAVGIAVWQPGVSSAPALHTMDVEGTASFDLGLVDATLHGSSSDPRVAWIELAGVGRRDVVFPKGFTARFAPDLQVLNAQGIVVFRAGDTISGACTSGDGLLLGWEIALWP